VGERAISLNNQRRRMTYADRRMVITGSPARLRLSPITLAVGERRQSLPIGRSQGEVESGCAEVILNEVKLRSNLLGLIPVDSAGRFPAPSLVSQDRQ
jgi:hypothetical protein